MIQKIERGRQGIVRALKATYFKRKEQKKNEKKEQRKNEKKGDFDVDDAEELKKEQVTNIQKTIRGFLARRKVEKIRDQELLFLGMLKKSENPNDPESLLFKTNKKRE